jgi:hypothetical protein
MAFKKIDKEFLITDSSLNCYGFRLLSSGFLVDEFKKNPIGFYLHADADLTDCDRGQGVLVRWEDFKNEGDSWFAKPVINLDHPRGERTAEEIENGFLNGASVGKIVALEFSEDVSQMLAGQTGPTITKWYCKECSLVDIPGNPNAVTQLTLVDSNGNAINLADFKTQKKDMKQIFLTPEQLKLMNLADNADSAAFATAFTDLVAKAARVDTIQTELTQALADKTTAVNDLAALKTSVNESKVKDLLDKAQGEKRITEAQRKVMATQFAGKPDELKSLLDATPVIASITEQLSKEQGKLDEKFKSLSYQQLDKAGLLPELKAKDIDLFKTKFKEEYGVEYKG